MAMTMTESATRHMAAAVDDLEELARLVETDTGRTPSRRVLFDYRSKFRRYGEGWVAANRQTARRWQEENPERLRERVRRWKADNPEKPREASRRWQASNPAKKLLGQCRRRARDRGRECTITAEMIEAMLAPMLCSATGLPLSLEHGGDSARNPWAPSIDRIDCSKGYVPGNVRVVCALYNIARGDFPDEAVMTMAKALAARAP